MTSDTSIDQLSDLCCLVSVLLFIT